MQGIITEISSFFIGKTHMKTPGYGLTENR